MAYSTEKLHSGAIWAYLQSSGLTIIQFVGGIALARILEPEDFGLFIAVTAVTTILVIQLRFGLPKALVQAREISRSQLNSCFWLMEGFALISAILCWVFSGYLQEVFADDRYQNIMILMTVTFFVAPYVAIYNVLLKREMNFKELGRVNVLSALGALLLTITLALSGLGPISLAIGGVCSQAISALLFARLKLWHPDLSRGGSLRGLLRYAWNTHLNNIQEAASERVDNILIGSMLGTATLGFYNRAFSLSRMPVEQFAQNLRPVVFSGLSQIQEDIKHTRQLFTSMLCAKATLTFPFLLLFIFIAEDFIGLLYGEKWLPAAAPLKLMIAGAFFLLVSITLRGLFAAQNLVGKEVRVNFIQLLLTVVLVLISAPYGLLAVSASIALRDIIVMFLLKRVVAHSHVGLGWPGLMNALAPAIIACLIAGGGTYMIEQAMGLTDNKVSLSHMALTSLSCLGIYSAVILVIRRVRPQHAPLAATIDFAGQVLTRLPFFRDRIA